MRVTGSFDTVSYGDPTGHYSDGKRMMRKSQQLINRKRPLNPYLSALVLWSHSL